MIWHKLNVNLLIFYAVIVIFFIILPLSNDLILNLLEMHSILAMYVCVSTVFENQENESFYEFSNIDFIFKKMNIGIKN